MEVLLERTLHLTEADDCTNVILPFRVPHDFDSLVIHCSYSPKYIENPDEIRRAVLECWHRYLLPEDIPAELHPEEFRLSNLLTLSLDCESGYVGAAHRQAPEQIHLISASESSPGFWRRPVTEGDWRAVISIHALAAGAVDYRIRIEGRSRTDDTILSD